jgi:amino acid transporter
VVVTISFLGAAAQEAYLTMIDIAVIIQLVPYVAIFLGLVRHAHGQDVFRRWVFTCTGVLGACATLFGIVMAFVPSRSISNVWQYEAKLVIGCVLSFLAGLYVFSRQKRRLRPE